MSFLHTTIYNNIQLNLCLYSHVYFPILRGSVEVSNRITFIIIYKVKLKKMPKIKLNLRQLSNFVELSSNRKNSSKGSIYSKKKILFIYIRHFDTYLYIFTITPLWLKTKVRREFDKVSNIRRFCRILEYFRQNY